MHVCVDQWEQTFRNKRLLSVQQRSCEIGGINSNLFRVLHFSWKYQVIFCNCTEINFAVHIVVVWGMPLYYSLVRDTNILEERGGSVFL
jgi:ribosome-associated toxin RatA of RatAB toxin-antitoxin module